MNTHREEKLRLAEAPDGTKVWVKCEGMNWHLLKSISWVTEYLYVVDDGIHIEERKAFAEGKKIEYKLKGNPDTYWVHMESEHWREEFEYRIAKTEPVYETRWRMLRDRGTRTESTITFFNQKHIDENLLESKGWYKGESIEVKVKQ